MGDDHSGTLICDDACYVLTGLGTRRTPGGQVAGNFREADRDEQLGEVTIKAEPVCGYSYSVAQRYGQPTLQGGLGKVQRLKPTASQRLGAGIEGIQRPVRIQRPHFHSGLPGIQEWRVIGDKEVERLRLEANPFRNRGSPVGGPPDRYFRRGLAGDVVADPMHPHDHCHSLA
jgi:hypothetical protein